MYRVIFLYNYVGLLQKDPAERSSIKDTINHPWLNNNNYNSNGNSTNFDSSNADLELDEYLGIRAGNKQLSFMQYALGKYFK